MTTYKPLVVERRFFDAEAVAIRDGKDPPLKTYSDLLWAHATLIERINCMQEILHRDRQVAKPDTTRKNGG